MVVDCWLLLCYQQPPLKHGKTDTRQLQSPWWIQMLLHYCNCCLKQYSNFSTRITHVNAPHHIIITYHSIIISYHHHILLQPDQFLCHLFTNLYNIYYHGFIIIWFVWYALNTLFTLSKFCRCSIKHTTWTWDWIQIQATSIHPIMNVE